MRSFIFVMKESSSRTLYYIEDPKWEKAKEKGPKRNVGLNLCSKSKPLIDSFFGEEEDEHLVNQTLC